MSTLFILGNGFDLAHGLDTSYWNFRTFLSENYPEFLFAFERMYNILPLDDTEPWYTEEAQKKWNKSVNKNLWKYFEEKMGNPDIDAMLDMSESVVGDLCLADGVVAIRDTMDEYWRREYGFVNELSKYIEEWVEQIDISKVTVQKKIIENNNSDLFITFNYTGTLEEIYKIESDQILHIHGSIEPYCDMAPIMGHGNIFDVKKYKEKSIDADEKFWEETASIYNAISEYLNTLLKDTEQIIYRNESFFKRLSCIDNIVILGLSFGDVDIPYLTKIKDSVSDQIKWNVYYYDDAAKKDLEKVFNVTNINISKDCFRQSNEFWD